MKIKMETEIKNMKVMGKQAGAVCK